MTRKSSRLSSSAVSFLLLTAFTPLLSAQNRDGSWPHTGSDLKPDPAITFGALPNGVRYAVMPNPEPPDRISLRLYFDSGSLMENDDQQGLAHFTEHMAFNGTKNFPAGEMVEYFQRLGMSFGGDTNAHTSFKETVYKLELPKPDETMLRDGLRLFRDYADGILFGDDEIDKERGVILSEKRTRDSVESRTMEAGLRFALPDALISRRMPIGTQEVIDQAKRDRFVSYYDKYYTSDRMVVVATGAVTAEKVVPLIEGYFASLKMPETAVPDPDLGSVSLGRGVIAMLHSESEASSTDISIETMQPYEKEKDTKEARLKDLRLSVANAIISQRLSILAKKEGAPFMSGNAYATNFLDFVRYAGVQMTCKPEQWEDALRVGEQELRKALVHGFTDAELKEMKAHLRNAYEQAEKSAETRQSRGLADSLVSEIAGGQVSTSPADDLAVFNELIDQITTDHCVEALRKLWKTSDIQVFVAGNLTMEKPEEKILAVYKASKEVEVTAPEEKEDAVWAYTDFGKSGAVVSTETDNELGITRIRFANNVRLNLKKTDFEKNSIRIGARIGGGQLTLPMEKRGLDALASSIYDLGGLEAHSVDDLERILAGKTVGSSFSVGEDAFFLGGRTNMDDFLLQCQLMVASLTKPGYRDEAMRQFEQGIDPLYTQLEHTPMGVYQKEIDPFLKGGDPRFGFPDKAELIKLTVEDVKAWLTKPLAEDYLEIGIVGDFEEEKILEAVAATFGALPKRAETKPDYAEARKLTFPEAGATKSVDFVSEIPKAITAVFWKTADMSDIALARRLNVLGSVFGDRLRLKVREELGETYSPYARNVSSDVFKGYGYLFALLTIDPKQAEPLVGIVEKLGTDLGGGEVGEDELERALKPLLTSIDQQLRSNTYWLQTVVLDCQERPEKLAWAKSMKSDYQSVTAAEVTALAKEYLKSGLAVKATVIAKEEGK
jgi:zinc protease